MLSLKEGHENVPPSQTVKKMNEKIYAYDPKRYAVRITGIGYFSVLIMLYSIYQLIASKKLYFIAVIVVCLYIVWESFITLANPDKVIISDDAITFKVKDREDRYLWKDIRDFRVKEFIDRKQVYIRINKKTQVFLRGDTGFTAAISMMPMNCSCSSSRRKWRFILIPSRLMPEGDQSRLKRNSSI